MLLVATRIAIISCQHLSRCYYDNKWTTAPDISERYSINVRSVNNALHILSRAGLLRSRVGGREPGYIFTRDPKTISLFDIVRAVEGEVDVVCCKDTISELKCECGDKSNCKLFEHMDSVVKTAYRQLAEISVADYIM